jgi:hypothetical protein
MYPLVSEVNFAPTSIELESPLSTVPGTADGFEGLQASHGQF